MKSFLAACSLAALALGLEGCVSIPPKDYAAFREHRPHSILVLPPINHTIEVMAGYSVLTTTSRPLAELGYYVFPVNVVDQYMKENGVTVPDEMQAVPLDKLQKYFGCDAVLYLTVERYGSKYQILSSNTYVTIDARLVDVSTGIVLWKGHVDHVQQGQSGLLEAVVDQIMNKLIDVAHPTAAVASTVLYAIPGQGLLPGPRRPDDFDTRPLLAGAMR